MVNILCFSAEGPLMMFFGSKLCFKTIVFNQNVYINL